MSRSIVSIFQLCDARFGGEFDFFFTRYKQIRVVDSKII